MRPTEFEHQTLGRFFISPYMTHTKLFATMLEYGSNGNFPTVFSREICFIVGNGARKQTTPQYGAIISQRLTKDDHIDVSVISLPTVYDEIVSNSDPDSCAAMIDVRHPITMAPTATA